MTTTSNNPAAEYFIPTTEWIDSIEIGTLVPDCFGNLAPVVEITARRDDIRGSRFVCLYTTLGENSRISGSFKVGQLHRNVYICGKHTSAELDTIEKSA